MVSSDKSPGPMPAGDGTVPPGKPMTVKQQVIDKGAHMIQSLTPIKQMSQHVCTFATYSHDMSRQIETHHFVSRLNQDVLQCAVYDSDCSTGRLIGIEYIVSASVFETLPPDEQKLWHSHAYEITSGLWVNPRVPEMIQKGEFQYLAHTYGKFWCTWQTDRGDRLPLGPPALMMSPQGVNNGAVKQELVQSRDEKYKLSTEDIRKGRTNMSIPAVINPYADYWKQTGKGFAIDVEQTEMVGHAPFP